MKELQQAKVLATAVKISKNEIEKRVSTLQEQLDSIKVIRGPVGPTGPKGDSGDDAKPVIVEAVGPQGEKGDKGDKGEPGNALSEAGIYEESLILNFTDGNKVDVGKVVGQRGGQGKQGLIGEQGPIGPIGQQGEQGPIGSQGVKGDKGDKGDIGERGERGLVGIQGDDGNTGLQGERGDTGPQGPQGEKGSTGLTGQKGDKGEKGERGERGQQGIDGRSVDLKPLQNELEDNLKTFKDSISSQVTRLAMSSGGSSSGGGEVLLYKLDDVDYNTTRTPTNGQALVWNNTKSKWEANSAASAITVKEEGSTVSSAITTLNFVGATVTASNTTSTELKINAHPEAAFIANSVARGLFSTLAQLGNTNSYIATKAALELTHLANTNAYIATKAALELTHLANTNAYTVRKTGAEQTMQPSLIVANTGIFQQGMPVRQAGGNNVTLALGDNGKLIWCVNTASAMNIHIPNNSAVAFPIGAEMTFLQKLTHASANTLGFSAAAGVTLDSKEAANTVADRHTAATLKKLATNTWILIGNIS